MVFNTATVSTAVTPAVLSTLLSHYLNRKPLAQKPTAHISYDEGLHLIRRFLIYASHHTVEDIQRFTSQWVPHPTWVKVDEVKIPQEFLSKAAEAIQAQLDLRGIEKIGGKEWWQWRRPGSEMKAEWIEMKSDYMERKKRKDPGRRVMLYVHGGAYFFGSVDEHRYQLQRHARKLKARVFAPRYRLAPQFPFPCGLYDCLAAYLYLLTVQDPTTIVLAGDSAGAAMVVSMLVTLRDRGIPLPAGAILISPWVDMTHSFPSVAADNPLDYIPPYGFHHRPSAAWPPPNADDMLAISEGLVKDLAHKGDHLPQEREEDAIQGFHEDTHPDPTTTNDDADSGKPTSDPAAPIAHTIPGSGHNLSIMLDGKYVEIKDQIHMYAANHLLAHPLVSPVLQPSLGGLPPLLIMVGGGEMLRDEQIYLAHKAANPKTYVPGDAFLDDHPHDHARAQIDRWKPTDVQLQVWDDLCHVAPTLSFTRPAKYMYRSIAQFGAWALARAQKTEIEILDDDNISIISGSDSDDRDKPLEKDDPVVGQRLKSDQVGKAGDPLPAFKRHMIRQRVDRYGNIFPLEPAHELAACGMEPSEIGVIKEGPVRKWMEAKRDWDTRYASQKRRVQKKRMQEMAEGYETFGHGEVPPPSALAGRRRAGQQIREEKRKRSIGMTLWAGWGSKHDKETMDRERQLDEEPETSVAAPSDGANARPLDDTLTKEGKHMAGGISPSKSPYSRSRSRRRTVTDEGQTDHADDPDVDENTPAAELLAIRKANGEDAGSGHLTPDFIAKSPTKKSSPLASPAISPTTTAVASAGATSAARSPDENPPSTIKKETESNGTIGSKHGAKTPLDAALAEKNPSKEAKRPKSGGIAFPFSLKRSGPKDGGISSSTSTATLTSAVGVPPSKDVRTKGAMSSGIHTKKKKDEKEAANAADASKAHKSLEKVVQNGQVIVADRPQLESFVTAMEDLPKPNPGFAQMDGSRKSMDNKSIRDYCEW